MSRVKIAIIAFVLLLMLPFIYFAGWTIIYRTPPSPPVVADKRSSSASPPHYVMFCSSLADNTFAGYPGHCYVVWSKTFPVTDFRQTESAGFVPAHVKDQIPSMFTFVPGELVRNAWVGNLQNFTSITAVVDSETYEETRKEREAWNADLFRVGVRDCVTFSNGIARVAGLRLPNPNYRYPQDYIKDLKAINRGDKDE
jgi:hypothetical protein